MATKFPDLPAAAAAGASLDAMQKLLAQGCDVNAVDAKGYSALMRAADKGQVDVMRLLIEQGASVHAHTAAGRSVLLCATASGSVDAVRLALDSGAIINQATAEMGTTALHFAAALGHVAIMELLIERGANPEAVAKNGRTILHSAVERGQVDALRHALELKTDVNRSAAADWETPLYLTTQSKDHKTALQLAHDLCSHGAVWSLACQQRIADQAVPKSDGKEMEARAKQDAQWRAGLVACITFWTKAYQEGGHGVAEVPVEVVERGAESVKTYVDDFGRSDANELVSRCKVCVLGPTGSGKTSLIRSLAAMLPTLTKHDTLPDGIELLMSTFTEARADQHARRLDVTFWDFPGQDVHQLAHSLFFSRRTLFVVTVDLPAYMSQLDNTTGLSDDQFEFGMNRFVTTRVFRWVRTILSQQPDAHILFAGTKEDSLKDPMQAREVWIDLKDRLEDWKQSYIQELQAQFRTDPESTLEAAHSTIHRVPSFHVDEDDQTAFTLESLKKKLAGVGTWLVVSSTDANSIANAREKVQELLSDAELGFPMWKTCMQVHEAIKRKCATARASGSERECLEGMIVRLSVLRKQLMREIDSLEREDCEHIIRSLDDLGDVLWFEREDAGELNDYVILDPKLGIEIVNEVINHDFSNDPQGPPQDGFLRHARLQTFPWWREMDIVLTHSFKALLQCFHLVFPAENEEMLPDSDLIVPAFWKSYPPASSRSLLVRQQSKLDSIAKNRWCWEYEVPAGIADALYEKLAVQTSTSYLKRAISADCIECACDEFASRITLIEGEGTTDVVRVEVAGEGAEMSWHNMRYYLMKMEMVLEAYPGMTTRRYVVDTRQVMERRYALEPAVKKLLDTIALGRDEQLVRADFPWFPSDMTWYVRKSWKDIGAFQQLQLDQLVRDKLEVLRKLAIAGDAPRRYPALWSLEYRASERKVVLRMSSDLSGRCFHVPIEMEANPAFVAKYGAVLKEGLSVCSGIVADAIPLPFVGTVIDAALSVFDTKVQETTKVHNLIDHLDMAASNKFESHSTALSPGAATAVLRDLLRLNNDSMDDLEISELTNLELAVTANGEYVWAHAHEITMLKDQITRCASPPSTWADLDAAADPSLSPTPQAQSSSTLAVGSKHAASKKISFCISSVTGLAPSDWNKAYCKWQVSYGKSLAPLAMGATSQHADSGTPPTWRHVTIALDSITSVDMLRECRLRVRVKRRTRLGWTKVFGGSEVPLRDYVDEDAVEQFHCEPIDVAINDTSPPTQWATVEFFVDQ